MALGTITVVEKARADGPICADVVSFTGDTSYPTGGSAFLAAFLTAVGKKNYSILSVLPQDSKGYIPAYDAATGKLKLYATGASSGAALAEVTNATNLSAITFVVTVISN